MLLCGQRRLECQKLLPSLPFPRVFMARTNADLVRGVLSDDYGRKRDRTLPSLEPYIRAAFVTVNRVVRCATENSSPLSTDEATEVETWLAAHFYCMSDQTYASKSTGGASGSFHGQTGMHLDATKYGQTAKLLDFSGCLTAIAAGAAGQQAPSLDWLGKVPSEQIDVSQRD